VLSEAGFFPEEWLDHFYHLDSPLGMHPDIKVPGIEMSTGGLGTLTEYAPRAWIDQHGGLTYQLLWLQAPALYKFFHKCQE